MLRFIVLLLFLISVLSGCYTVIKHPEVVDTENTNFKHEIYFSDDCQQCHSTPADKFLYDQRINPSFLNYIQNNERWNHFYQAPWWYKDIFYGLPRMNDADNESNTLPTTTSRRRFPGANSNVGEGSSSNVSSGNNPGSSTRVTNSRKTNDTDSPSDSGSNRQKRENQNVRKVNRESERSDSNSNSSDKDKK